MREAWPVELDEVTVGGERTAEVGGADALPGLTEEFAREYGVPLEAVREALDYVANSLPLIEAERERETGDARVRGLDQYR